MARPGVYHKRRDAVGEFSRSVATPPVIGKMDLPSGGRTGLPGRHLWEQTANSEFANSVRRFLLQSSTTVIRTLPQRPAVGVLVVIWRRSSWCRSRLPPD